jgi:hypothetical protein
MVVVLDGEAALGEATGRRRTLSEVEEERMGGLRHVMVIRSRYYGEYRKARKGRRMTPMN